MFRRLLILLLLVATAWGPQWCCCQFRNLLSATTSVAQCPGLSRPSCCQRARNDKPDRGDPTDQECPCKNRSRFTALSGSTAEVVLDLTATDGMSRFHSLDLATVGSEVLTPGGVTRTEGPPGARPSGRHLLRLKQTLRC